MKKRINLYLGMTGGFGSLSQTIPIIEQLNPQKYNIICNISQGATEALRKLKFNFIEFPSIGTPQILTEKSRKWWDLDHYWGRFGFRDYNYVKKLIDTRICVLEKHKPDIFMTQFCPQTEIVARIMNKPLICVTQSCMHPKGKNVSWWERPNEEYPKVTNVVNDLLKVYNLKPIEKMEDLNQGDLTFIPSFPEFDPINDLNVNYLGPLNWESSNSIANDCKYKQFSKPSKLLIVVYTGHLFDSGGDSGILILNNIVKAFSNTEFNIILSTGFGQKFVESKVLAENIVITDWIPISKLINTCRLFIHHGGHGSCMTSVINGIPSLVIPTFTEREFNARQLNSLGIAKFVLPNDLTPELLKELVLNCINDDSLYENAKKWRNELQNRNYQGALGAAKKIEDFF